MYKIRIGPQRSGGGAYILVGDARDAVVQMERLRALGIDGIEIRDLDERSVSADELAGQVSRPV